MPTSSMSKASGSRRDGDAAPVASRYVKALLSRHDIPSNQHVTTIADVLGVAYTLAYRRMNGQVAWEVEEIEMVAKHYGESLASVVVANGVVYDLGETGSLFMFNSDTGALISTISDPDGQRFNSFWGAQPAVVNATVYVSTSDSPSGVDVFNLAPAPSLSIARVGKQVVISWPTN